jgi:hypothetical protein
MAVDPTHPAQAGAAARGVIQSRIGRRGSLVCAVILAVALALAGCGGGGAGASGDSPAGTVQAFYDAAANGDGEAACALLTSDPGDSGNLLAAAPGALASIKPTCKEKVADVVSGGTEPLRKAADSLTVKTTEASSSRAQVALTIPDAPFKTVVVLVKRDGMWRIEQAGNAQFFK